MEDKFQQIRNELDSLGYTQPLLPECLPLVEKLLLDLNRTTTSLQKYLRISQYALEVSIYSWFNFVTMKN